MLFSSHIDPFFIHIKHIPLFVFELLFFQVIMWFMFSFYSSLSPDVTVSKSCFQSKFLKQTCICQILLCNNQPQKISMASSSTCLQVSWGLENVGWDWVVSSLQALDLSGLGFSLQDGLMSACHLPFVYLWDVAWHRCSINGCSANK